MPIETMMEGEPPAPAPEAEATEETASIPASIVGGQEVKPGDVVRLEVISVDGDTITVKYAQPDESPEEAPATEEPEAKGSAGMAAAFD